MQQFFVRPLAIAVCVKGAAIIIQKIPGFAPDKYR